MVFNGKRKFKKLVTVFSPINIKARMPKQMSSTDEVVGGDMTTIKSGKKGSVTLQYLLLTKSNYAAWSIKMRVNL